MSPEAGTITCVTRTSLLSLVLCTGLLGCAKGRSEPYPVWATVDEDYRPMSGSANAFDGYVRASELAFAAAPKEADRVAFTDAIKASTLKKLSSALVTCSQATKRDCRFEHRVTRLFGAEPVAKGWRLLGRGMVWKIDSSIAAGDLDAAVAWTLTATKFGFDLAQGDAQSASLGFAVCDEARQSLAPQLQRLSAQQATNLHVGLARVLSKYSGAGDAVRNEGKRIMLGVQFVQDCQERKAYKVLEERLGKVARPGIDHLRGLSDEKRVDFFNDFARAMKSFTEDWAEQIDMPKVERTLGIEPENTGTWRRFARAFCGTIAPLASVKDATLARTRLMAVSAWASAKAKKTGKAPYNLAELSSAVTEDPYTGKPLLYTSSGADFKVYSVGADGRDDGGDSDEAGLSPDVVLSADSL